MNDAGLQFREAEALTRAGRFAEAAEAWQALAAAQPESSDAWNNLGVCLAEQCRYAEAEAALRSGLRLQPAAAHVHHNLALFLHLIGRWEDAVASYRAALALAEDLRVRNHLGQALLGLGQFEEGWRYYEARRQMNIFVGRHEDPRPWAGEPVAGRHLLVWSEQGYGDQIQFARFVPRLVERGATVSLVAYPVMVALLAELPVTVVEMAHGLQPPPYDYWTNLCSLPLGLGVGADDLGGTPYLRAPADRRSRWKGHAAAGAIGYCWHGKPSHANDANRSMPSAEPLLEVLSTAGAPLVDLTDPVGDFADLAAVIEQLDLVVTVDTSVAHLAGALGVPCWVLLPWFHQDWRWMLRRSDSPWYSSIRLFRQPTRGDWKTVMKDLREALAKRRS